MYGCYRARVTSVMDFGCFCELLGFRGKFEGLCHVSSMAAKGASNAKTLVDRGQNVFVKVMSKGLTKMSLSMKDVDQHSGEDLNPIRWVCTLTLTLTPDAPPCPAPGPLDRRAEAASVAVPGPPGSARRRAAE